MERSRRQRQKWRRIVTHKSDIVISDSDLLSQQENHCKSRPSGPVVTTALLLSPRPHHNAKFPASNGLMPKKSVATTPDNRQMVLEERRKLKMARSAHAYVRGNTLQFYEWLKAGSGDKLPQGPPIWICGDCHVGNLGPVANADGKVEIEIRDLDQTVIGNPAHDLIRLGLSLATAARGSDLPGVTTAMMMEHIVEGYQNALSGKTRRPTKNSRELQPIEK